MSKLFASSFARTTAAADRLDNPDRIAWFTKLVGLVIIMNALDGVLTLFWVCSERAVEANPLMAAILRIHPVLFISLKMALVYLGSILLLRFYERALARFSLIIAFLVYGMTLLYHGWMICLQT